MVQHLVIFSLMKKIKTKILFLSLICSLLSVLQYAPIKFFFFFLNAPIKFYGVK